MEPGAQLHQWNRGEPVRRTMHNNLHHHGNMAFGTGLRARSAQGLSRRGGAVRSHVSSPVLRTVQHPALQCVLLSGAL